MASPTIQRSSSPLQRLSTFKERNTPTASITPSSAATNTPLDSLASDPIFSAFLSHDFDSARFSSLALSSGSAAARAEKLQDGIRLLEKAAPLRGPLPPPRPPFSARFHPGSRLRPFLPPLRRRHSPVLRPPRQIRDRRPPPPDPRQDAPALQPPPHRRAPTGHDPRPPPLEEAPRRHGPVRSSRETRSRQGRPIALSWIGYSKLGKKLRSEGMRVLERGLEGLNQAEVGAGLQVFYNLGELRAAVDGLINKYKSQGVKSVSVALDIKAISASSAGGFGPGGIQRSGTPQIGGGAKAKEALWQRMNTCMDQLHSIVVAVWHLQRVLSKKRDPFTHVLLLDEVMQEGDPILTDRVWEALVKSFASQMKSAFTASSFMKEIFTGGYPKLYSMIENLLERISHDTDVKGVIPAISSDGKDQMVKAIETFQTAFLTVCWSRLSDLVNTVFPVSSRGSVPPKEHISRIISRVQEEIEGVQPNGRLTLLVLHEISKVLLLLAQRAEFQVSTGPEARQITGPATPAQLKNFALCLHLQEIHARISSMMTGLPSIASDVLSPSLGTIYGVACDSVTSLFQAMQDRLESCILQIHEQNFGMLGMDAAMDNAASPYMEELQKCILHFRSEFLSRLLPSSASVTSMGTENICTRLTRSMASRVLRYFIRHASLVRPLSESGKLRMARDMAELELAVGQNLFPVEQLGRQYRALRAFRPVIFLETSQLGASPLLQDLEPSVVLHHLYVRGPEELQSPMQRNKLTPLQYSLWLDSQGEDQIQIWKGIKATLDDYDAKIRARGDKEFSPVYPLMLRLGSSLSERTLSQ
ncbi:golgi transport complex protein-like protein [Actinidia rufa]|uniref:Golgi transport complex protein-like protein n=1 Tax=Actinidia rufa TaxID=165716 RepID=A0A7J0G3Y9_9ERIC|nr:golgi transport complex protein-like protein [Actinidia rufa]